MKIIALLAIVVTLTFASFSHAADLYRWVDEKGNLHVTDYPPPSRQVEKEKPAATLPPPPVEKQPVEPPPLPEVKQPAPAQPLVTAPAATQAAKPGPPPAPGKSMPTATTPLAPSPLPQAVPAPAAREERGAPVRQMPAQAPAPEDVAAALLAGFMTLIIAVSVAFYVYFSLCLFLIAKKLNVDVAWAAWVPILQVWPFLTAAGKPCWWVLLLFVPLVNVVVGVYLWMCISENLGRNKALGLLMLLPVVNIVFLGVLAFSKKKE